MGCGRKGCGALLAFLGVAGCCAFSFGAVAAEGPHGPHGEITADPNAFAWLLPRAALSLPIAGLGLYLVFKKPNL